MAEEKELEMNKVKQQRRQGAGGAVVSHYFIWSRQPGMRKWKGTRCLFWALEGGGNWKCRGPSRGLLIDSWIKCSSLVSSARTELCSYYWFRKRTSGGNGIPSRKESGHSCVQFILPYCWRTQSPSCPFSPLPSSSEPERIRQIEASSHPFHPTTSVPISFLFLLFLSLLAGPD